MNGQLLCYLSRHINLSHHNYVSNSTREFEAGAVAALAEERKRMKYSQLDSSHPSEPATGYCKNSLTVFEYTMSYIIMHLQHNYHQHATFRSRGIFIRQVQMKHNCTSHTDPYSLMLEGPVVLGPRLTQHQFEPVAIETTGVIGE